MVEKNVVLIETLESTGTGIIYPCKYKENSLKNYIIFTNNHVLCDVTGEINLKEEISLTFYDDFGIAIRDDDIIDMKIFKPNSSIEKNEDICALLVSVSNAVVFNITTDIMTKPINNRDVIFMEGYPGIMLEDEVNTRIQFQGVEKTIFPLNREIGVYQITDDYHWYNSMYDQQLLEGISGSPIYIERNGKYYLVGMNQSVSNIENGENPFKLVYYLRFEYILNFLRKQFCIIFRKISEDSFEIEWIYGLQDAKKNQITFLLLGGSGAGKSSLAKDFAYHGDKLKSTNDGQTTRTEVLYQFKINEEKPRASVNFLKMMDFVDNMISNVGTKPIRLLMAEILQLDEEEVDDEKQLLVNIYDIIKLIALTDNSTKVKDTLEQIQDILYEEIISNEDKIKCYEQIIFILANRMPICMIHCILDKIWINRIISEKKMANPFDDTFELINSDKKDNIIKHVNNYVNGEWNRDINTETTKYVFEDFQREVLKCVTLEDYDINTYFGQISDEDLPLTCIGNEKIIETYKKLVLHCEGFFDISEFSFLGIDTDYIVQENKIVELKYAEEHKCVIKIEILKQLEDIYKTVYKNLFSVIAQKIGLDNKIERNHLFDLNCMNSEDVKLLHKCLQVTSQGSLTGIIKNIEIVDMISNEYASILRDLDLNQITFIDTCGLDHIYIMSEKKIKERLNHYYHEYINNHLIDSSLQVDEVAILYVKKLDSGKPDELRTFLPCVEKTIPKAPVYCVFSGIDIFYRTDDEIDNINFSRESDKIPKIVNYFFSDNGKAELSNNVKLYTVMKNNLIPYCGKKELVNIKYSYYRNNVNGIRKLFTSVAMKEKSCMEIMDIKILDKSETCEKITEIVKKIFEFASLQSYKFRWNTIYADANSFYKRKKAGASLTYRHQFNELFHEGYIKAIDLYGDILAVLFKESENALKSALENMEQSLLGNSSNLGNVNIAYKNEFRELIEKMYNTEKYDKYHYNPFDDEFGKESDEYYKNHRNQIFDDVFNFTKGLDIETGIIVEEGCFKGENETFLIKFSKLFKKCLRRQIEIDNQVKAKYLLKLTPNYLNELQNIRREFMDKYATKENVKCFNEMMIYYFQDI
ncbi:hypothetical protein [Inconstantimicrobium mannanitabidum]|uniref:Uncharacterized protein n=1 Tax=Inconstantimicrobium mannanitabidum TaxID=1604901 RepID=A0ACB5R6L4_9CLOT|nr:hypothetical protein [Clostridium sp. TW13]GKX64860.1 hypothetical protein rsdtw13_01180 [Clostridium sp. TW13]